jgi:7,8-dihydroneopterin aldolase/epimerase/oxygenase
MHIRLTGLEVFAHHGVFTDEKDRGQEFLVDVDIDADIDPEALSDDLSSTIDYGTLAQAIHDRVAGERWNLIETVANRVADLVLEDGLVRSVTVTVHKPGAPIPVPFDDVAVRLRRTR